jgi:propionate CoA-transferase
LPRLAGAGGFINISQSAKSVVFVGTFTADGLKVAVENGRLVIIQEGRARKFVAEVEHRTFSGREAVRAGQPVLYVTERCVFRLTPEGLELIEVAPGIDIERDIIAHMGFDPVVRDPALMDERIFAADIMGLREAMLDLPFDRRFSYDAARNTLYLNFERLRINSERDVQRIKAEVEKRVKKLGHKVNAVVNYTNATIAPEVLDHYGRMVEALVAGCYLDVTRYGTSGFLRAKLGHALKARGLSPHIYESAEEASAKVGTGKSRRRR